MKSASRHLDASRAIHCSHARTLPFALGVLCKETYDYVIRLAPPLIISQEDLAWLAARMRTAFAA